MNAATRRTERSLSLSLHAEVASGSAYEAHKEAAKNDNLSAGSRIGHGIDAVKSKGKPFVRCSPLEHNLFVCLSNEQPKRKVTKLRRRHTRKLLKNAV